MQSSKDTIGDRLEEPEAGIVGVTEKKTNKKSDFQFTSQGKSKPKKVIVWFIIILLLLVVGVSAYFYLGLGSSGGIISPFDSGGGTPSADTVQNPLTGEKFNKEDAPWFDTRPMAVMVNNHIDARPQSGVVDADLVYEIVAEGGITRFLAFFLTNSPEKIGPVRSTREYYLVLVKELGDSMIMHIGWSPQALVAIETWPVRSLGRGGASFWRDNPRNVATEHTAYVNGVELRELSETLGWEGSREFKTLNFKDDVETYQNFENSSEISIDFWYEGDYSAIFNYNAENNSYLRYMGYNAEGEPLPHADQESGEQVEVKNVVVQFVAETPIVGDDKSRLEYQLVGSGEGLVFIDGKVVPITWAKEGRDERTIFYDTNGSEIKFNRGKFWISIVPDRNVDQVVY